jgi:hypothetical protein
MKNIKSLKGKKNDLAVSLKQKSAIKKNLDLFLEECRLQKRFFTGQVTIEEYKNRKKQ